MPGSSPLTRGKPRRARTSCWPRGLIPAHAGKTRLSSRAAASSRAHPRSRGENDHNEVLAAFEDGSSPLTRGKPHRQRTVHPRERLIPAHAGKTLTDGIIERGAAAHPRSRGENSTEHLADVGHGGSSPLTRGKPESAGAFALDRGLIPAHAGKTGVISGIIQVWTAHPRSRGENWSCPVGGVGPCGSSPLTRGKLLAPVARQPCERLIPAHAGKTLLSEAHQARVGAHPRSRGENNP